MENFTKNIINKNKAFNDYINEASDNEKIRLSRFMAFTAAIVYFSFTLVDIISIESKEKIIITTGLRLITVLIFFLLYKLTFKREIFLKYYSLLFLLTYWWAGTSILLMMHLSPTSSIAFNTYFAGMVLVISTVFPFTYLNPKLLTVICVIFIIEYLYVFYYNRIGEVDNHIAMTLNHVLFMVAAFVLGLIIDHQKKYHLFNSFKYQHQLKRKLLTTKSFNPGSDNVSEFLENEFRNAELSNLELMFKFIDVTDNSVAEKIKDTIIRSLPIALYSFPNVDKQIILYGYYDSKNQSIIDEGEKQVSKLLASYEGKYTLKSFKYSEGFKTVEQFLSETKIKNNGKKKAKVTAINSKNSSKS
jgi:hypothetical protein